MFEDYQRQISSAIAVLLSTGNEAVVYFTRRDLLNEAIKPVHPMSELPEVHKIFLKQKTEGYWEGAAKTTAVYPEDHSRLIATFKAFRWLVERYRLTREYPPVQKAAEYLFKFQTQSGDIRGFIGNQYATYYTGYVLSLLIQAGYQDDRRIARGMDWLLQMRQDDGGWTIPLLTHYFKGNTMYRLTSTLAEPVEPDRSQPFSHNWTDMALRAFAAHPAYRRSEEARSAGKLLKSSFFQPDNYSSYRSPVYWTRFIQWWPNLLTALESLLLLGFSADDPDIANGIKWFFENQKGDQFWDCSYNPKNNAGKSNNLIERAWITLRICRMLKGYYGDQQLKTFQ
jgi:hypothetical protein